MNEPRPAMISARPPDSRSSVANSWKTRTGSSELSTVTALRQPDPLGARGRRGEHDRGRRDREVRPVVLADAEDVQPDLVGELDLLEQVGQPLLGADRAAGRRVPQDVAEGVDPEFHAPLPSCRKRPSCPSGQRALSRRASSGADSSMTNSRSTWTASTNVVSAPLRVAVASTAYSPPGVRREVGVQAADPGRAASTTPRPAAGHPEPGR